MRYVFLPSIFVLVGCADSAPTSTDHVNLHSTAFPGGAIRGQLR